MDFFEVEPETRQDGIATEDAGIVDPFGSLARPIDDGAIFDRIEEPAKLCAIGDVL